MGADVLEVSTCIRGERLTVTLAGELDVRSQDLVISLIDALRPMSWPYDIDVTDLTFIDATGLRALRRLGEASQRDAASPANLIGASCSLLRLLERAGKDRRFAVAT
jgi:anti-anti-sigma factor